jgi:hypothetical protein
VPLRGLELKDGGTDISAGSMNKETAYKLGLHFRPVISRFVRALILTNTRVPANAGFGIFGLIEFAALTSLVSSVAHISSWPLLVAVSFLQVLGDVDSQRASAEVPGSKGDREIAAVQLRFETFYVVLHAKIFRFAEHLKL